MKNRSKVENNLKLSYQKIKVKLFTEKGSAKSSNFILLQDGQYEVLYQVETVVRRRLKAVLSRYTIYLICVNLHQAVDFRLDF